MARKKGSHSETTAPAIRAAALRLIAEQGFAAMSMRQLAAAVGLQVGALYLYLPDKQSLLLSLLQAHYQDLLAAWAAFDAATEPAERILDFARFHIDYHLDHADEVFVALMELRNLEPRNRAAIGAMRRQYDDILLSILQEGHKSGVFRVPDAGLAMVAVMSMLNGAVSWYREGGKLPRQRVIRIYSNLLRRALGA